MITATLLALQPVPSIDFTLPGQVRPAPLTIPATAEVLPFGTATVIGRPSPAARHALLRGTPPIPPRGIAFTARCLIDRTSGRVAVCLDATVPEGWRASATLIASLYHFRLSPAQAGGQGPLAVTIADRIVAGDVRGPTQLFTYSQRPPGAVVFAQGLTAELSEAYYPVAAKAANEEARIRVDCQVQLDLSLFCLNASAPVDAAPIRHLGEFQLAAYQLTGALRSAPTLANGAPAAGTVFRTTIVFRLPTE